MSIISSRVLVPFSGFEQILVKLLCLNGNIRLVSTIRPKQ
uniref:Uncharacterized protein n=1 Tax=Rhizophora mucronata TaxID=61149 RepID=A0A2P2NY73_RHIMU